MKREMEDHTLVEVKRRSQGGREGKVKEIEENGRENIIVMALHWYQFGIRWCVGVVQYEKRECDLVDLQCRCVRGKSEDRKGETLEDNIHEERV